MLIEKHNKVISLSDNIKKLLSIFCLMQIILNTLLICCIGFIIVISLSNEAGIFVLVKVVVGYFAIMTETFILCFAGEYLSHKSISIADAAYDSLWYDLPSYQSKIITFIIMRSQSRLTISAGKFTNLSLEAFTTIVKASASYISVFLTIY
nr:PREDICTED: odorant receptor 22c-like [Linepithema humile]